MMLGISNGAFFGAALCVPFALGWLWVIRTNPSLLLRSYPPHIQAKFGPLRAPAKRQSIQMALVFFGVLVVGIAASLIRLNSWIGSLLYGPVFASLFSLFFVVNLFDLLILDWLIFVIWQPAFVVLPDTAGLAGYKNYSFHFRGFLSGLWISLVLSLVIAGFLEPSTRMTR